MTLDPRISFKMGLSRRAGTRMGCSRGTYTKPDPVKQRRVIFVPRLICSFPKKWIGDKA